jgi:hypothetical protein
MNLRNKNDIVRKGIFILALLVPFLIASYPILTGSISFWYDPARDFLLAYDNLHKLTLIGPTSGIPGLFYGPYWVWLLSFGLLFSLDPKVVIFIVLTLPYFTIFPYIIYKFRTMFGLVTSILLWLLFILGNGIHYAINPWNPHLAPLLFLILVYLIIFTDFTEENVLRYGKSVIMGIVAGLIINFHISFGLGVLTGVIIFFILYFWKIKLSLKSSFTIIFLFGFGVFVTSIPFIVFELRHGFHQIQTILNVAASKGSVVTVTGISKEAILFGFFNSVQALLQIPLLFAYLFIACGIITYLYQLKFKKIAFKELDKKLLLLLFSVSAGILSLYLSSKNPVWSYHFIGTEIIALLFIGIIIHKNKFLQIILAILVCVLTEISIVGTIQSFQHGSNNPSLATREYVTRIINTDAKDASYTVFAYNPAIYSYEYAYLFKWIAQKDVPYDPGMNPQGSHLVYLIIPAKTASADDFINSRTSNKLYKTIARWDSPDGTIILKRIKK